MLLATAFVALGPITMTIYAPAMPALARALDTSATMVQLTLTIYLFAFAAAQLVYGPLSDRFGRRPILIAGMILYIAASLACARAPDIETLMAARFVQAMGACAGPAIARALVRDQFTGPPAARVLAIVGMAITLAPAVGPVLGGHLQGWFGWRSIFLFLTGVGACVLAVACLWLPETNRTPDRQALVPRRMIGNYRMLLGNRVFLGYVVTVACTLGGLLTYSAVAPFVFIDLIGVSPQLYGWLTLLIVASYFVGSLLTSRLVARTGVRRLVMIGMSFVALGGGLLFTVIAVGFVAAPPIIGAMMVWLLGMGLVLPNGTAGAMGPFPAVAGAASAMMGFLQMGTGALGSLLVAKLYDGTPWALAIVPPAIALAGLIAHWTLMHGMPMVDTAGTDEPPHM